MSDVVLSDPLRTLDLTGVQPTLVAGTKALVTGALAWLTPV